MSVQIMDVSVGNPKDLFLFPSPKSQGTKLTDADTSQPENIDLENSDIQRYINKEMNASLSESVDLARKLKESYGRQRNSYPAIDSLKINDKDGQRVPKKKKPTIVREAKKSKPKRDKPLARNKNNQIDTLSKPKPTSKDSKFPEFEDLREDSSPDHTPIGLDNEPIPPHPKYMDKAERLTREQYDKPKEGKKFYNKGYTPVKNSPPKAKKPWNNSPQMKGLLNPEPTNHQFATHTNSRSNSPSKKTNFLSPRRDASNTFQTHVYHDLTNSPQRKLSGYLRDLPPQTHSTKNPQNFSSLPTADHISNSQTLNTLLARFYTFFPNFKSTDSLLNPAMYKKEISLTHEQAQATYFLITFYQQYTEKLLAAVNKNQNSLNFQTSEYQKVKQIKDKYENQVKYERETNIKQESNLAHLRKENRDLLAKLGKLVQEKKLIEANYKNNLEKWKGMVYDENSKNEHKSKDVTMLKVKIEEFRQDSMIKANQIKTLDELLSKAKMDMENMRQDNGRLDEKNRITM